MMTLNALSRRLFLLIHVTIIFLTSSAAGHAYPTKYIDRQLDGDFAPHQIARRAAGSTANATSATTGDSFFFPINGTALQATVYFGASFAGGSPTGLVPGFLDQLHSQILGMKPTDNLQNHTIWPVRSSAGNLNFPGVFQINRACSYFPLDSNLLQGLSDGFTAYFPADVAAMNLFNFYGSIGIPGQAPFFNFGLWFVSPGVGLPERRPDQPAFGNSDYLFINDTKTQISNLTNENDLLLFVGNTASYFYYAFGFADLRDAQLIAYNGNPYSVKYGPPSQSCLDGFLKSQLTPAFTDRTPGGRVILITHVNTGDSIASFVEVMQRVGVIDPLNKPLDVPQLINLAYRQQDANVVISVPGVVNLASIPVGQSDDDFARLDLAWVGKLLPYFGKEMWVFDPASVPNPDDQYASDTINFIANYGALGS